MQKILIILSSLLAFLISVKSISAAQNNNFKQGCNITHFDFQSNVSLGKNNELNRTFAKLNDRIQALKNVSWRVNDSVTYIISNANPTFYYRDTKQKAQIVGNNTIVIDGGYAEVMINFTWQKIGMGSKSGTATVSGLSDQIFFTKDIVIYNDFFRYDLLDYINITYDNPMNLQRIDPPISSDQQNDLMKLVNNVLNVTTLRHQLQNEISLYYDFFLLMNLHEQEMPIKKTFFYRWWDNPNPQKQKFIMNFTRRPVFIDIQKDGIHYGYEASIDEFPEAKCGKPPRVLPLDSKKYGGSQEFISYTFYENVLRFASKNGQMDTQLNKQNWGSRMFQFYAGDIYELFPKVADRYVANVQVTGNCKAEWNSTKLYKGSSNNTFNVSLNHRCQITVGMAKIVEFSVGSELQIEGRAGSNAIDFYLRSHSQLVSYDDSFGFVMENKDLGDAMISDCLNLLYEEKLYGSGWRLSGQRDDAGYETSENDGVVFDFSRV